VLAFLAAALLAPSPSPAVEAPAVEAPAVEADVLEANVPWWERITVTVDDRGKQQSCRYETSLVPSGADSCNEEMAASLKSVSGPTGVYSKVTFERRFSPGRQLDSGKLQPGDTLIGRSVMFLTLDASGAIASCHVVATSGETSGTYGCEEAKKEQFRAQASADAGARQAFMTILAYGHTEHMS
jgi:hypothetical protein